MDGWMAPEEGRGHFCYLIGPLWGEGRCKSAAEHRGSKLVVYILG
jgi:hypothetical protein